MIQVVTDWSYALAEFLVVSLFRAFLFLAILATFTLQMFFSFDQSYKRSLTCMEPTESVFVLHTA